MIVDPLNLAIISMIVGILIGAIGSVLAVMISNDLHKDNHQYPSEEDIDEMYVEYVKGRHER